MAYVAAKWELLPNLYAGLGYLGGQVDVTLRAGLPGGLPDPSVDIDVGAVQVPVDFDTRDDPYFPRTGWLVSGRVNLYRDSVGSDFDTNVVSLAVNRYLPFRDRDVLALRGYVRSAGEDAPFFLLSTFGGKTDLRGYDVGRYRDRLLYAVQAEYRWRFSDAWVFTGFAGAGEIAEDAGGFFEELLPAAGAGARYMLSQKHQFSLSFDVAVGKHGSQFYFGIGEAF